MKAAAANESQPLIVQLLLEKGQLDPSALREVRARDGELSERVLIKAGLVTELDIARAYAEHLAAPLLASVEEAPGPTPDLSRLLPEKLCRDQLIAPVALREGVLDVAFVTP